MKMTAQKLAVIAALALSSTAFAQGYVGAAAGVTKLSVDCSGTTTCDDTDVGGKLFGGFKFTPNLSGELNYFHFGKAEATIGAISGEAKVSALGAGVAFSGMLAPSWTGVARLGVARVKTDVSGSLGGFTASDSETATKAYYGVGVGFLVMPNLSIDGAIDYTKLKYGGESDNVGLFSVGVTFSF